jgi:hypothetical protein
VLGVLSSVFYRTLGKAFFVECHSRRTKALGTDLVWRGRNTRLERPLTKEALPSANLSSKCDARQRAVRSHLLLTTVNFTECHLESPRQKIFVFLFSTKLFVVFFSSIQIYMFNCGTIIKVFAITIRFSLFNWISSDNSDFELHITRKIENGEWKKWYSCYLALDTT